MYYPRFGVRHFGH